ncbi:MAG: hypothetical protein EHM64_12010 [Ignavibacteriae bacterium]|nr:MAG: hypothetical protein EHM64_12010 [Ignavibacteriota bacterium]
MKKLTVLTAILALSLFAFQSAFSQSANQTVTIEVQPVSKISVSGPVSLVINDAVPGQDPLPVSSSATSYNITHNSSTAGKISASINSALPAGIKLEITMAPVLGTSAGKQDISSATTAVDVVTGIGLGKGSNQTITYDFSATLAAGVFASTVKTVNFTVTN